MRQRRNTCIAMLLNALQPEQWQLALTIVALLVTVRLVGKTLAAVVVGYAYFVIQFSITYTLIHVFGSPVQVLQQVMHHGQQWLRSLE